MPGSFWNGKRVLVTGHTGFKGAWLALWLSELGAEVTGYALPPPTEPSLFVDADVARGLRSVIGDVRDLDALTAVLRECQPEVVFHMAAQALVRASYRDPVATYATNVMGTVHLLEAVRQTGSVRAVVNVTSDKCYANTGDRRRFREEDAMGGSDPYSNSKGCAELVTSAYRASFFAQAGAPALASARAGNVIGGGDWAADRLVPDCIRALGEGGAVRIRNPEAVRPWQFVLEPLSGYLMLAERLWSDGAACAEGWNFGPDEADARPVSYVADRVVELWGRDASWTTDGGTHPREAAWLSLDCTKARERLSWRPAMTLDEALRWTVRWYRDRADGRDARERTLEQIRRYAEIRAAM
ncbi:MAG: CDP-glucose 4,6-dehydratase [Phycisphaerae bacterium]|nr:CDP-glucose 4,6-dehydratase [Phycisphaerae bacterium]